MAQVEAGGLPSEDLYDAPDVKSLEGISQAEINEIIGDTENGHNQPFQEFYYLITEIFLKKEGSANQKDVARLADNLKELSGWAKRFNELKAKYYGAKDSSKPVYDFATDTISFINDLLAPLNDRVFHIPNSPNGACIEVYDTMVEELEKRIQDDPETYDKLYPAIGGSNLTKILRGLEGMGGGVFFHDPNNDKYADMVQKYRRVPDYICAHDLKAYWEHISHADDIYDRLVKKYHEDGSEYWENDPILIARAADMSDDVDSMSQVSSLLTGVSSTESSKMKYKEEQYNRMLSFVKEMLNDWQKLKKLSLQKGVVR